VIVPFLTRKVHSASPRYPRLIKNRETGETTVLLDFSDVTDEIDEELKHEERQEMERLLYVALTRARHTLVLAFDNELFAKASGELHKDSQTRWLKADKGELNEIAFASVVTEPVVCADTAQHHEAKSKAKLDRIDRGLPVTKIDKSAAIGNASVFVRKLNPSGLPVEEIAAVEERWKPNDLLRLPRPASPALRYGLWWHDFVQRLKWDKGDGGWNEEFAEHQKLSPDPARSLREWKLLLNHLSGTDDFRKFAGDELITHPELPFLWRLDQGRCLEGVVDLALFNSAARKCLILDWKTDRVPPDSTETLYARYRPQLAAYWKAVREMTQMGVEAAIYSTSTGAFLLYKEEELAQEWTRLKALPPEQLFSEMAGDQAETPVQLEFFELNNRARRG
jgi:ATP-dependent exoDNAse (exonuclease V) beta subunit